MILRVTLKTIMLLSLLSAAVPLVSAQSSEDQIVATKHQVTIAGKVLKYTASAGRLPILNNESGETHGNMFFVAYKLDSPGTTTPRPVTFLWNGGPGSSSSLVHLLGFGPRSLEPDGTPVDNQGTWLDQTDLVFVDPIGTGYSRPTKAEYGQEFYQTRGDAESVAEFIRLYRTRFDLWDSPVFLAGESYGVTRAAGVAEVLQRRGIPVNGVVLMGLLLPLGELSAEQRIALAVPSYTAAAYANKKLSAALQRDLMTTLRQSEEWSLSTYETALAQRNSLAESERQSLIGQLAQFTGLNAAVVDAKTLSIGMDPFTKQLLADSKQVVGRYDTRLIGPIDPSEQQYDPTKDPSLKEIINDIGVVRYMRNELQYKSDLKYQGPFGGGYPPATTFRGDWMSVRWNRNPDGSPMTPNRPAATTTTVQDQPLQRAMTANPRLKVLVACGYYDLVCSYAANTYLVKNLDPQLRVNVVAFGYGGGHAIYTDKAAQLELKRDVTKFMQDAMALKAQSTRPTQN